MGNKLCAPLLKKNYRSHDTNPWHNRKDSHLLRLWADVFRVHGDGEYMRWERVSDDVVPVNISCIEDTPTTVFHVTAYNRQVEKIFDVCISQPGTIICPATECFVHWRDTAGRCEWGLNFATPTDAQRFRDCCSFPTQRFARKASSASSLRLSPPKRHKSKAASASSPSSPVRQHHSQQQSHQHQHHNQHQGAAAYDKGQEGCEHTQGLTVISKGYKPNESFQDDDAGVSDPRLSQSPPCYYAVIQRRKPEVTATSSEDSGVTVVSTTPSRDPAFRRSFPASHSSSTETHFPPTANSISGAKSSSALPTEATTLQRRPIDGSNESQSSNSNKVAASTASSSSSSRGNTSTMPNRSASAPSSGTATPIRRGGSSSLRHGEVVRPSSAVSDMAHQRSSAASYGSGTAGSNNSPKHVQISDIVSVNITGDSLPPSNNYPGPNLSVDKPNGILKRDNSFRRDKDQIPSLSQATDVSTAPANDNVFQTVLPQVQTSFVAGDDIAPDRESSSTPPPPPPPPPDDENLDRVSKPSPSKKNNTLRVDTAKASSLHPNQHKTSSSSESPEWPSPPEPLTPQTPQTPNAGAGAHMSFDSDTIQRMLRSLPSSPLDIDTSDNLDQGFHEEEIDSVGYSRTLPTPRLHGGEPTPPRDPQTLQTPDLRQVQPPSHEGSVQVEKRTGGGRGLFRTKSLTVHDRYSKVDTNRRQQSVDTPYGPGASTKTDPASHRRRMFNKIALEKELKKRNRNMAANYPDSGIGMGPGEATSTLRSESKLGELLLIYYQISSTCRNCCPIHIQRGLCFPVLSC